MASLKHIYFLLLLLITAGFPAIAQKSETSDGKSFLFKNYTMQNGLIHNGVLSLAQDKRGYIWIGSLSGLSRFDGKTFYHKAVPEIYNNPSNVVYLETTSNGNVISTSFMQGVFVQQDGGRFKKYLESGKVELSRNIFSTLKYCPDGKILAAQSNALFLVTTDSLQPLYHLDRTGTLFQTIDIDKENRIWFGGRLGLGFLQFSDTAYEPVFLPEFKDKFIIKILFDSKGTLLVATTQGYYRIKWRQPFHWDNNYTIEQPFPQLANIFINYIYLDKEQNLWIPTNAIGVYKTNGDSITLHLTQDNGLASSTVFCVLQDREENYWFGTNSGISMIRHFDDFAITQNGVRYKDANQLLLDRYNRLWVSGYSKLNIFQDNELIPVGFSNTPIEKKGIYLMEISDSVLIISNDAGLYQMPITSELPDLRKLEKIVDFPANNITVLRSIVSDSTGIWIGTQNKIFNYYNHQFLPVTFNHPDSVSLRPTLMRQDKYGYYWYSDYVYGLYKGTLSRPDNNTLLFDNITAYKSRNADSAFVTAHIKTMDFDREGNLWFSSAYTGVYKLTLDRNGIISDKLYSTENGLLDNDVGGIICDEEGSVWFMSQKGTVVLKTDSSGVEYFEKFDVNERIEGKSLWPVQMGNKLYLLTDEGIFETKHQVSNAKITMAPTVNITNLLINGAVDTVFSLNTNNLRLKHGQNNLTIEYSAIIFRNTDDVRYQYKLEGADNDWSVLSDRGFVEYASLRSGRYSFKVRAIMVGADTETGEETSLSFRIAPAYYQTVWFYALIFIFILSLFYAFYNNRMRHAVKMERMRMRIASDLHDEIGSTLSSIYMLSDIASQQKKEDMIVSALNNIGENASDVLNSMDDIIWSVNPQNDSLSNLSIRLREYAIPVCQSKDISFYMNVDETINAMKLGMEERRNIFLIAKEAVNNAVKYSGCSQLTVAFVLYHKQLDITITDNGCGFDPSLPTSRNGITNMARRAKQIGMDFYIKSEKNKGTRISLKTKNLS